MQIPQNATDQRLGQELADQLHAAAIEHSCLPNTSSTQTSCVVDRLRAESGNADTLAQWAKPMESGTCFGQWPPTLTF